MAQAALTALDTWTARDWRKEERRWREELRRWRADDIAFRAEERRFKAEERMFRAVRHRCASSGWRHEIMQQRHVDNAMHLWDRPPCVSLPSLFSSPRQHQGEGHAMACHVDTQLPTSPLPFLSPTLTYRRAMPWHGMLTPNSFSRFPPLSPLALSNPFPPAFSTKECSATGGAWRRKRRGAHEGHGMAWHTNAPLLVPHPLSHSLFLHVTSTKECNRRSVEEKAEHMRAMAWLAAIVGGFTMTAPVEFTYSDPDAPMALVTAYALCTALVPSLMVVAAMIAVFVLGAVLRMGKLYVHEREEEEFLASARYFALNRAAAGGNRTTIAAPPAALRSFDRFWDLRCESDWRLTFRLFSAGITFFFPLLATMAFLKFHPNIWIPSIFSSVLLVALIQWYTPLNYTRFRV
ncbi:unnamed protein product [Closterium sp. Naga37s-1]|nr:unnamed protein product [Closterium sp. Naga37s-1]